jgi:hypothetical protein
VSKKKTNRQPRPAKAARTADATTPAPSTAEPVRVSRKEMRRQQQERDRRMRNLRIGAPLAIVVLGLVALLVYRLMEPEVAGAIFVPAAAGSQHDANFQYPVGGLPPTGGVHHPSWQNCGIYTEPVGAEYVVHSLEHGAIWVTYHPDLPAEQIAALQDSVRRTTYVILSPYPEQSSPVVATAWDIQLAVDSADDERIQQFINKYRRTRGPEAGASCEGGIGVPIG